MVMLLFVNTRMLAAAIMTAIVFIMTILQTHPCDIPISPIDPPVMPFTAFSLPTSPAHTSTLFSPITPAPPILIAPAAPVVSPRPLLLAQHMGANPSPSGLSPLNSNPLVQQVGDGTAFTSPQIVASPVSISDPSGHVDTV